MKHNLKYWLDIRNFKYISRKNSRYNVINMAKICEGYKKYDVKF